MGPDHNLLRRTSPLPLGTIAVVQGGLPGGATCASKAIIHRDLKPSNILVIRVDLHPVPKVIDFGVAKALGQKLTEKTLFTGADQMIGTPAYMSPEQAELGRVDIDTRSDIYSLGVILYELLTGVITVRSAKPSRPPPLMNCGASFAILSHQAFHSPEAVGTKDRDGCDTQASQPGGAPPEPGRRLGLDRDAVP
jgi:serine/threonine protein kinase